MFCDRMDVEKTQRVPLSVFSALWDFFSNFLMSQNFTKVSPIHQYSDTLKYFCHFWALDMAPTWAGPSLFRFERYIWKKNWEIDNLISSVKVFLYFILSIEIKVNFILYSLKNVRHVFKTLPCFAFICFFVGAYEVKAAYSSGYILRDPKRQI